MQLAKHTTIALISMALSATALAQGSMPGMQHGSDSHSMSGGMQHGDMQHGDMKQMKQDSAKASKMPFDHQFLDTMSMHHSHGIQMAEMAQEHAASDEIKEMAKKMIDDQQQDIKQMQSMKEQWYAGQGDAMNMNMPGMKESMKSHEKDMEKLNAAKGQQFDSLFLTTMGKHHTNGIKMAKVALKKVQHQEVKKMAQKIADTQTKEKAEMARMKKQDKSNSKQS